MIERISSCRFLSFNLSMLNILLCSAAVLRDASFNTTKFTLDFPLLQDHLCPIWTRSYHSNTRSSSCVSPITSGDSGLHCHLPDRTNPGPAACWSVAAACPSPAPQLSITESSWPDPSNRWSSGKEEKILHTAGELG